MSDDGSIDMDETAGSINVGKATVEPILFDAVATVSLFVLLLILFRLINDCDNCSCILCTFYGTYRHFLYIRHMPY